MGKTRDLFKKIRDAKGTFHAKMGKIKDRNGMDLTEEEDIKNRWQSTQKNYTKKFFMIQITMMVRSPRGRYPGIQSQVGLRQHHYEQSYWMWWNSSWAISSPTRWCYESAALSISTHFKNSAIAIGLGKVSFHSFQSQTWCQRIFKLPRNCTHFTC